MGQAQRPEPTDVDVSTITITIPSWSFISNFGSGLLACRQPLTSVAFVAMLSNFLFIANDAKTAAAAADRADEACRDATRKAVEAELAKEAAQVACKEAELACEAAQVAAEEAKDAKLAASKLAAVVADLEDDGKEDDTAPGDEASGPEFSDDPSDDGEDSEPDENSGRQADSQATREEENKANFLENLKRLREACCCFDMSFKPMTETEALEVMKMLRRDFKATPAEEESKKRDVDGNLAKRQQEQREGGRVEASWEWEYGGRRALKHYLRYAETNGDAPFSSRSLGLDLDVGHQAKRPLPERRPRKYNRRTAAARRLRYYDNMATKLEGKPAASAWATWSINHLESLRGKVERLQREAEERKLS